MQAYKKEFIDLAIELGVLKFGEFTLKSGRVSPYFFNAGLFNTGYAAARVGRYYAATIADSELNFDMVFGPAYKGIPLAALAAASLAEHQDIDVPFSYNRKEAKAHGEGGSIVGAPLEGRVLIIDDVITAGTAVREAHGLITAAQAPKSRAWSFHSTARRSARTPASAVQELAAVPRKSRSISIVQGSNDLIELARGNRRVPPAPGNRSSNTGSGTAYIERNLLILQNI